MSDGSWVTDQEEFELSPHRWIRVTLPQDPFRAGLKRTEALLKRDQHDNFVSVGFLQALSGQRWSDTDIGMSAELEWCCADAGQHFVTGFRIVVDSEYSVVLGARACEDIEHLDRQRQQYTLLPAFVDKGKQPPPISKEEEDKKRIEENKKKQMEKINAKYGIQHPPTGQQGGLTQSS